MGIFIGKLVSLLLKGIDCLLKLASEPLFELLAGSRLFLGPWGLCGFQLFGFLKQPLRQCLLFLVCLGDLSLHRFDGPLKSFALLFSISVPQQCLFEFKILESKAFGPFCQPFSLNLS